ncbi:hypothetical protein KIW84_025340 [Lathyrus oleraceus]|uniref:Uncharacterized protein n=1 Tax=Pisum sativum TaxID=3888 RepID=A0A9D4YK79_PEA|nr:hypothetical protein KIW84_025340 [Pisum sativum]
MLAVFTSFNNYMGNCVVKSHSHVKEDDSLHQDVEFASGKVHLINTKESWDQKLEQARGDGKMVTFTLFFISSTKLSNVISTPIAIFLCCSVSCSTGYCKFQCDVVWSL